MKANIAEALVPLAVPLARLEPDPRNPRRGDTDAIARSYSRFGQRKPIVARRTGGTARAPKGVIVAGNHQYEAAQSLAWDKIAVVWTEEDEATATAYGLADNRTSDRATYDTEGLVGLLEGLSLDLRLEAGFDEDEVEGLRALMREQDAEREAAQRKGSMVDVVDVTVGEPTHAVERGDHWIVGPHHLFAVDVMTGWGLYTTALSEGALLLPYAGPFVALSERPEPLVLVQPDPFIAGHIVDKYASIHGEESVGKA